MTAEAKERGVTRSTVSMEKALKDDNVGIFAIGNAPTALYTLIEQVKLGKAKPALIIGAPIGLLGRQNPKKHWIRLTARSSASTDEKVAVQSWPLFLTPCFINWEGNGKTNDSSKKEFYGIGVGPGIRICSPCKTAKVLDACDVVITPVKKMGSTSVAFEIVKSHISDLSKVVEMNFPMISLSQEREALEKQWRKC